MPRRKKNGQSPARVPGGPPEGGSLGHNTGYKVPQGFDGAMANNFPSSPALSSSAKEGIVKSMQEMFSHLDREVIYIVLSECDFKVENAMDSLLELSRAAEGAAPIPSPVSGFERTAAALLSPHHFSESGTDSSKPQLPSSPSCADLLTEELDLLVDQELETLTTQQDTTEEHQNSQYLTTFPPLPLQQQVLPEQFQSSLQPGCIGPSGGLVEHASGTSSTVNQLSTWEDETVEEQQAMLHQISEMPADRPKCPLDLGASGRPSAFQVYKKQEPSQTLSDKAEVIPSESVVRGARSKVGMLNQEPLGHTQPFWNLEAPVFSPHVHESQEPAFITPVVQPPSIWTSQPRHASPWLSQGPVSQAPLKPHATIPKSWVLPAPQPAARYNRLRLQGRVLVLLRGAPGSGKSTLANALVEHNPGAVKLSTDDYFSCHGRYQFDPGALGEAHGWNQNRAKEAFERGANPIIIDNTNMQGWEMRPYVVQALKHGYKVLFREPDTWWKNKPRELERRSTHKVPLETIRRMLNGYERFVSVQSIMGSQMPELKLHLLLDNQSLRPMSPEAPCPDLVGQSGLTEGCKKSCPQLFSSLPDVSSIEHSSEAGMLEDNAHKSTESLDFHPTGRLIEKPEVSDWDNAMDSGKVDSELEAQFELNHPTGDQRIPDCIVESVMNEDRHEDEVPVAFSESIGQRVRRTRPSRMSGFDMLEPADLVKSTIQSDSEAGEKEKTKESEAEGLELVRNGGERAMPKRLEFVGDWPTEATLEQRQVRRREGHKEGTGKNDESMSQNVKKNKTKVQPGPNITEFQKLLDLIQTGVADIQTTSSPLSSFSPSSEGELEKDEEADGRFEGSHSSRSNSEERKQNVRVDSSRGELPDCVLDWKAADICMVKESRIDDWEGLKTDNNASSITGENDYVFEIGREAESLDLKPTKKTLSLSALITDPFVISKSVEANVCHEGEGNQGEGGVGIEPGSGPADVDTNDCTQNGRKTSFEADDSHISELCQSPVCEGSVEAESGACGGGSQERKLRQGRRSGKQCKLALTFTQNCPASSQNTPECLINTDQNINCSQKSIEADVEPNLNRNSYTSVSLEPNLDLFAESKFEAHLQPPSALTPVGKCCTTQTEPRDFALLWRLNHQDNPDEAVLTAYSQPFHIIVPSGNSSQFVLELPAASSTAVLPSLHRDVPYRVVHEKSTQVEEKELGATQDRLESLRILSGHFKLVSFDTLEDLYDKCHQDLEWTTNLLLDSGEIFFKDEDSDKKDDGTGGGEDQKASHLYGGSDKPVETRLSPDVKDESHAEDWLTGFEAGTQQSNFETGESGECSSTANGQNCGSTLIPVKNKYHPDTTSHTEKAPQTVNEGGERCGLAANKVESEKDREDSACGGCFDDETIIEESVVETEEQIANRDEIHWLVQAELDKLEREERQKERSERRHQEERKIQKVDIQSVELKLPTEVALQLTELFGPVGVDPGMCSTDDNVVQMDLNLAKLLHQKWKETIQEKQRQMTLSLHLLQEGSVNWAESQVAKGYTSLENQAEGCSQMPFMDHWNVFRPHISLRDIIKEEQALQENIEKTRQSRADLDWCDGATLLKKDQLYSHFPSIDRHFLQDIFRDHNYSLSQTELFLHSLLDEEPVKTVVAPEAPRYKHQRAASKEREMRRKPLELITPDYQDTEDPEYEDFRAEASLQRKRQLESLSKAAEAFKQGRKEVASFYAQQGHLHGKRMHEANHRAAVQIFERVNSSLLPNNILDLHGLHVHEALEHLAQVLQDKTTACEQGLCRPQLSVITGRGNHSQGGVARIRPAVINYLTNKHYRFTEPKPGLVLVSLK